MVDLLAHTRGVPVRNVRADQPLGTAACRAAPSAQRFTRTTHTRFENRFLGTVNVRSPHQCRTRLPSPRPVQRHCQIQCAVSESVRNDSRTDNKKRYLAAKFSVAPHTNKLDLSHCGLSRVPEEVWTLTDLEELSLVGNHLTSIPEDIGKLTRLKRLAIAGNRLRVLPSSITQLTELESLYAHGNLLSALPPNLPSLSRLRILALGGNRLTALPDEMCRMPSLEDLSISGNALSALPEGLGSLQSLRVFSVNGNRLAHLPASFYSLSSLEEVSLQGNCLQSLPPMTAACRLPKVKQLSLADNSLRELPPSFLAQLPALEVFYVYGNELNALPAGIEDHASIKQLWAEGNPFDVSADIVKTLHGLQQLKAQEEEADEEEDWRMLFRTFSVREAKEHAIRNHALGEAAAGKLTVGLDTYQTRQLGVSNTRFSSYACDILVSDRVTYPSASQSLSESAAPAAVSPGYFKIQFWSNTGRLPEEEQSLVTSTQPSVLVIAFGSAPGVPNWGGVLTKVAQELRQEIAAGDEDLRHRSGGFDTLYIVDPARSWYTAGGEAPGQHYRPLIEEAAKGYERVVMLGDSMGATAALLFSGLAASVHAFCPQVDLSKSPIRPGKSAHWLRSVTSAIQDAVQRSTAAITVHTGDWEGDVEQVKMLPQDQIQHEWHQIYSHRVALTLERHQKLVPLLKAAICAELDHATIQRYMRTSEDACANPKIHAYIESCK